MDYTIENGNVYAINNIDNCIEKLYYGPEHMDKVIGPSNIALNEVVNLTFQHEVFNLDTQEYEIEVVNKNDFTFTIDGELFSVPSVSGVATIQFSSADIGQHKIIATTCLLGVLVE
jgi:hypothetical protein